MKTNLIETVQELTKNVPKEKKEKAIEIFWKEYNKFPSAKRYKGNEYLKAMDEKLTIAYETAINYKKERK